MKSVVPVGSDITFAVAQPGASEVTTGLLVALLPALAFSMGVLITERCWTPGPECIRETTRSTVVTGSRVTTGAPKVALIAGRVSSGAASFSLPIPNGSGVPRSPALLLTPAEPVNVVSTAIFPGIPPRVPAPLTT